MENTDFKIKVADTVFDCSCTREQTKLFCRGYLSDEPADYFISAGDAEEEEYLNLYRAICETLIEKDTVLIHGSALAVDGQATLFGALSGTGKSTHAKLWRQLLGDKVTMVNDDKPLVRTAPDGAVIYGTPWQGKHRLGSNISIPLKHIVFLHRAEENSIVPMGDYFPLLLQQTYRPKDPVLMAKTLDILGRLSKQVSFWSLGCSMDISAAETAFKALYPNTIV